MPWKGPNMGSSVPKKVTMNFTCNNSTRHKDTGRDYSWSEQVNPASGKTVRCPKCGKSV